MENKNKKKTPAKKTAPATGYIPVASIVNAVRDARAASKPLSVKYLTAHGADRAVAVDTMRAYHTAAAALLCAAADARAAALDGNKLDPAHAGAVIKAAKAYAAYFAADKTSRVAVVFDTAKGESNAAAAMRIAAAVGGIAVNATAKDADGNRNGRINIGASGKASDAARAALEQWTLNRLDGIAARDAAAMLDDAAARRIVKKEGVDVATARARVATARAALTAGKNTPNKGEEKAAAVKVKTAARAKSTPADTDNKTSTAAPADNK